MINLNKKLAVICFICCIGLLGCKKYLEEKTNGKLAVPTELEDFQALMDNVGTINSSGISAAEISADDYVLTDEEFDALTDDYERRMNIWEKDYIFSTDTYNSWRYVYNSIYTANTVLIGLGKIPRSHNNSLTWDNVKGQALFIRGNNLLDAAIIWCPLFDQASASTDLGLPLRMSTDFNEISKRSSVQQTYDQIISDLIAAAAKLPVVSLSKHRPSKAAAYGLLARAYLAMRNYPQAYLYADSCSLLSDGLMDFNDLDLKLKYPITINQNKETIYVRYLKSSSILNPTKINIPTVLYNSFETGDLRKDLFFTPNANGYYNFKGSYTGSDGHFSGVALNEIYLIKAECLARANQISQSMNILNELLLKRWDKTKTYVSQNADSEQAALSLILKQRRMELIMRGLRWLDIRRLNKEGAGISLKRIYHHKEYILPANDLRFVLPIPEDVIAISGMEQNKR